MLSIFLAPKAIRFGLAAAFAAVTGLVYATPASAQGTAPLLAAATAVPIDWSRFHAAPPADADFRDCRDILNTATRYNAAWLAKTFQEDPAAHQYVVVGNGEHDIRPAASAVYGLAVLLKTGSYDERAVGVSREEALRRAVWLIKGVAATHKANRANGSNVKGWGDQWQSAFWAALLGHAGYLLWDDLDADAREMACKVVEHEADRFIAPGYKVPYWTLPDDHVVTPGDTKAEENAWNADILQVAVAMMPHHPHVAAWKRVGSELMVSAFTYKTDLTNPTPLDGTPVKDWIHGYNVRADGAVINHNILHPDYMATPTLNLRAYLVQPLAGQPIPQTAAFNADRVYRTLIQTRWPAPPYKAPGGTIYQPSKSELYYPMGTDWSKFRFDIYYLYDTFAVVLNLTPDLTADAQSYLRIRADRMRTMQARNADGSMYIPSERPSAYPNDQMVAWQIGDALLLRWLKAQGAIGKAEDWMATR